LLIKFSVSSAHIKIYPTNSKMNLLLEYLYNFLSGIMTNINDIIFYCIFRYILIFWVIALIGLSVFLWKVFQFLVYLYQQKMPVNLSNFWSQYCFDYSWILITGAAEGAGRAYAEYFADLGFNLFLLDIQATKLNDLCNDIKSKHKNIDIKQRVIDFSACLNNDGSFYGPLLEEMNHLDLAVIINNVGILKLNYLELIPEEFLRNEIVINCGAGPGLTLNFLHHLMKRKKKSAVINMSSWQADISWPYVGPYSATKAFVDSVSRGFGAKYEDKIDFLSLKPFGIRSRMSGNFKMPFMEEPDSYVKRNLLLLGKRSSSYGNLTQCFIAHLLQLIMPNFLLKLMARESIAALEKIKKD
jgi:17beta-estradiol 17-dehydrogenase / very-long-chain 3-oxoacyl-CoA reductase